MIPDKQEELECLYKKVIKDFPELGEEKIEVKYDSSFCDLSLVFYPNKKEVIIMAGIDFFDDSLEEKEASIAHELGHYMEDKDKDVQKLNYSMKLQEKLDNWLGYDSYFGRRKLEILKDHYIIGEIAADNWAIKKGYSEGLLKFLNKTYDEGDKIKPNSEGIEKLNYIQKDYIKRIVNIEQKIKEK